LMTSVNNGESFGYEVKELMNRLNGEGEHLWLDSKSRFLKLLPKLVFQGSSEHNRQQILLSVLRRSGVPPALDMSSLVSRMPDQYRITRFSAFIKEMIEGVESSNTQRHEALSLVMDTPY
jgi:hypothetical protein